MPGLILDGTTKVGSFDDISNDSWNRILEIKNVRILEDYIDIPSKQSNTDLLFLVTMTCENSHIILDNLGFGKIYGDMWNDGDEVIMDSANFVLSTQSEGDKNAN